MSKKILIVDDAAFMRLNLRNILEGAGYTVVGEAKDGKDGVEQYIEYEPDLVTMDITMPEMDGIKALKIILDLDSEARIIICSSISQKPIIIEALEAGARDYIVKPFNAGKVIEAVKNCLK